MTILASFYGTPNDYNPKTKSHSTRGGIQIMGFLIENYFYNYLIKKNPHGKLGEVLG